MTFDEYQKKALETDLFANAVDKDINSPAFIEKILGLVGESGEVADKFKKIYRDDNGILNEKTFELMKKELGDVLWYIASISRYLDIDLNDVAIANIEKLASRKKRSKLKGAGDNR